MGKRYLLAIGGPRNLEWVADMGPVFKTLVPRPARFQSLSNNIDLDDYLDDYRSDVVSYYKQRLGDPETKARKEVYVVGDMGMREAEAILGDYLMKQFINMEDPIDDSD